MQTRNRPKVFYKMTYAQEGGIPISKGFYNTFWVAANVSKVSTNNGWAIFLNKATIISLFSFRITTLIPASLDSTNITLSKFAFTLGASRGFHLDLARLGQWTWTRVFLLYSDRRLRIYSRILWEGKQGSLLLILFRRHHTEQATLANNSSLGSCVSTTETKALRGVKMRIINFHLAERFHYSVFMVTSLQWFYGHYNPQCLLRGGKQSSLLLILFRQHHIDQATIANNSCLRGCVSTTKTRFEMEWRWGWSIFTQSKDFIIVILWSL